MRSTNLGRQHLARPGRPGSDRGVDLAQTTAGSGNPTAHACSLNYKTTSQFRSLPSRGGRLRACQKTIVWQVHKGVTAARTLLKADIRC